MVANGDGGTLIAAIYDAILESSGWEGAPGLKEIIGGRGLSTAAARLAISLATARTHTYRIFEKTGTGRQAELIRRFFETGLRGPAVPFQF
jgi:hypothetical protein